MKYSHLVQLLWAEPSLITPGAHAATRQFVLWRLAHPLAERGPATDICGNKVERKQMGIANGIADIPVAGVIGRGLSPIERGLGAVDSEDIAADVEAALANPEVHTLLFDIDSPGGMVNGTPEMAQMIRSVTDKRTVAWSAGEMASAAYYLAAGAQEIYAAPSAIVGSIGVYVPWLDESAAFQMQGLKMDIIRSDPQKGMGYPGTSLTPEQRAELQERVDEIAHEFKSFVAQTRAVDFSQVQAKVFSGASTLTAGLVDGIFLRKAMLVEHLTKPQS